MGEMKSESTKPVKPDSKPDAAAQSGKPEVKTITHKVMFNNKFVEVYYHDVLESGKHDFIESEVAKTGKFWDAVNLEYIYSINGGKLHRGDFIDVGGNTGNHSLFWLLFEKSCDQVLFVEPYPKNIAVARKNFEKHGKTDRVIVVEKAAYSKSGIKLDLFTSVTDNLGNIWAVDSENGQVLADWQKIGQTETVTIDDLVSEHDLKPIFIKIDVEGGEYNVLLGAVKTIAKFRPLIYTEIWADNAEAYNNIHRFMQEHGYAQGWRFGEHCYWFDPKRNVNGQVGYNA